MTAKNLTDSDAHIYNIEVNVPLIDTGDKVYGITIKCFECFGAWSFNMHTDLPDEISDLFVELCRKAGIQRRLQCAVDLEIGKVYGDYEFNFDTTGATAVGDFFTLEAIFYIISTVFIPYWQQAARQIMDCDHGKGWNDTWKRAEKTLFNAEEFSDIEMEDYEWLNEWRDVNCAYDRKQLIRGNNYRIEEDKPLERFVENSRRYTGKCRPR